MFSNRLTILLLLALFCTLAYAQNCFETPSNSSCSTFVMPSETTQASLDSLCMMMPNMVGCSIRRQCEQGGISSLSKSCEPFSLLVDICRNDPGMAGMSGCSQFNSLCSEDSVVSQCIHTKGTSSMISTSKATESIFSACAQHSMSGCELCPSVSSCPDPLLGLSQVCQTMRMESCSSLESMCSDSSNSDLGVFCDDSLDGTNPTPIMKMYFHTGILEYILFKDFVPTNNFEYSLAIIFVFMLGISNSYIKLVRARIASEHAIQPSSELQKLDQNQNITSNYNDNESTYISTFSRVLNPFPYIQADLYLNLLLTLLMAVVVTVDYLLMLVAMTFNVGLFFAVVAGLACGSGIYAWEIRARGASVEPSCC